MTVLEKRMTENQKLAKAMLARDEQPRQEMKIVKAARTGQLSVPQPFSWAFCHVA